MNEFLSSRYDEKIYHLALGLVPLDAKRQQKVPFPIQITFDAVARGLRRPKIVRHDSCVFVLLYEPGVADQVEIRIFDSMETLYRPEGDRRRFVPRRLSLPVLTLAEAKTKAYTQRVRQPGLFPGAAYDVSETATGWRGRVEKNGKALRWARVEAKHPVTGLTVGTAHGDDRGEFLLLLDVASAPQGGIVNVDDLIELDVIVYEPITPVVDPAIQKLDPMWDLPIELAPLPGDPDTVSPGMFPPDEWIAKPAVTLQFKLGTLRQELPALTV